MAFILIADDDLFFRKILAEQVEHLGHKAVVAENGLEAFNIWENFDKRFDCIVLDVYMKGMSGFEVIDKIFNYILLTGDRRRKCPIILMTSDESEKMEINARKKGIFSFLIKPFSKEMFKKTIEAALSVKKV